MCLILFAYKVHPQYKMVLASNRDEFLKRETMPAHFWDEHSSVLAGVDLEHGGTWMGVTKEGKFAALTNYRKIEEGQAKKKYSRGKLVKEYLTGSKDPFAYLFEVSQQYKDYEPFNLLIGDRNSLYYYCSEKNQIHEITEPGVYALSNHELNTPWPKVETGKELLEKTLFSDQFKIEKLFKILANDDEVPEEDLPETGLDWAWERDLAKIFVTRFDYATRSSTVILWDWDDKIEYIERVYEGRAQNFKQTKFKI